MPLTVPEDFDQFDENQIQDLQSYQKLINEKMRVDAIVKDEMIRRIWKKISDGACQAIWKLLFDSKDVSKEHLEKTTFLKTFKEDACFYSPEIYNDWIVTVRDELLKRKMFEFWKNVVVAEELGPAWARDSDLYDDGDDPEPAKFYKFAGCEAVWLKTESKNNSTANIKDNFKVMSLENPLEDYRHNMVVQGDDPDNCKAYEEIFSEVRATIWRLLFTETSLSTDYFNKAADLLEEYKCDACYYPPFDYNKWIVDVRDELFKRKYYKFWQDIIVKKELGIYCAEESEYLDDINEPKSAEFYKTGEDLIKAMENK